MENTVIEVVDVNGALKNIEVLKFIKEEHSLKEYIIYSDYSSVIDGNVIICSAELEVVDGVANLNKIEDASVIKDITKIISDIVKN